MTRVVYLEGSLPPLCFFLFFSFRSKCNTNGFLIQTDLVLSLRFRVATSRRGKSESDQEIGLYLVFFGWKFVCGIRSSQVGSAHHLLQYPETHLHSDVKGYLVKGNAG